MYAIRSYYVAAEEESENERLFIAEEAIETQREEIRELQQTMNGALGRLEQAERALRDERERVSAVERELSYNFV